MAALAATLCPPLQVERPEGFREPFGSVLVVFNHYTRPESPAWWTAIALGAALARVGLAQPEPRWVMTAEWRHLGAIAPVSRWAFRRIATMYNVFLMPPMPPDPKEVETRAAIVRQVIEFVRNAPDARVCLAPEGYDNNDGRLIVPPPGAGRFILHLCRAGMIILPAGVCEEGGAWCVRFGPTFTLAVPDDLSPDERDEWASRRVMRAIAKLLPEPLRGKFTCDTRN
jgi:hypothetical protein